jgi:hypothetical protein
MRAMAHPGAQRHHDLANGAVSGSHSCNNPSADSIDPRAALMTKQIAQLPVTSERLKRALVLLAYFIELDGDVHLQIYEKFDVELAELRAKEAIKDRARKRLGSYLNEGGDLKAIR